MSRQLLLLTLSALLSCQLIKGDDVVTLEGKDLEKLDPGQINNGKDKDAFLFVSHNCEDNGKGRVVCRTPPPNSGACKELPPDQDKLNQCCPDYECVSDDGRISKHSGYGYERHYVSPDGRTYHRVSFSSSSSSSSTDDLHEDGGVGGDDGVGMMRDFPPHGLGRPALNRYNNNNNNFGRFRNNWNQPFYGLGFPRMYGRERPNNNNNFGRVLYFKK